MASLRFLLLFGTILALRAEAQGGRDWSPNDRMVIGDFTRITSIAAAPPPTDC